MIAVLVRALSQELFLDKASTRVRRKQEAEMAGRPYLDRTHARAL